MEKLKKYCFIFVLLLLFMPIQQRFWKFSQEKELHGQAPFSDYPTFHFKDWNNGKYQELVELKINIYFLIIILKDIWEWKDRIPE